MCKISKIASRLSHFFSSYHWHSDSGARTNISLAAQGAAKLSVFALKFISRTFALPANRWHGLRTRSFVDSILFHSIDSIEGRKHRIHVRWYFYFSCRTFRILDWHLAPLQSMNDMEMVKKRMIHIHLYLSLCMLHRELEHHIFFSIFHFLTFHSYLAHAPHSTFCVIRSRFACLYKVLDIVPVGQSVKREAPTHKQRQQSHQTNISRIEKRKKMNNQCRINVGYLFAIGLLMVMLPSNALRISICECFCVFIRFAPDLFI